MKTIALTAFAATLLAGPAFAQSQTAPAAPSAVGASMNESQIANLWRASKLDGVDIYNNNNEKIGEIDDVLIDRNGKAMAVVADVGGFLGIGTHRVALKFEDVKFSDTPRDMAAGDRTTTTTTTRDANAPVGGPPSSVTTRETTRTANAGAGGRNMYPDHAMLNMTKDQLKALPQISYGR
jgi:sporulation protein YlmC with PRC-barrel domain